MPNRYVYFFALCVLTLSSLVAADLGFDNPNLPRIEAPTRAPTCGNCSTVNNFINNTFINQTVISGNAIWFNDSDNQIKVNATYTGPVNISNRDLYLPGWGFQVIRDIAEGDYGIDITGEVADGIRIGGATDLNTVFNGYGVDVRTILFAAANGKSFWGYLSNVQAAGNATIDELTGYIANPRTINPAPYTGTVNNLTGFKSEIRWDSGNASTVRGVHITTPSKNAGNWTTHVGIDVEDISSGDVNNYAIRTRRGLVQFGGNVSASNLCYSNGSNCAATSLNLSQNQSFGANITIVGTIFGGQQMFLAYDNATTGSVAICNDGTFNNFALDFVALQNSFFTRADRYNVTVRQSGLYEIEYDFGGYHQAGGSPFSGMPELHTVLYRNTVQINGTRASSTYSIDQYGPFDAYANIGGFTIVNLNAGDNITLRAEYLEDGPANCWRNEQYATRLKMRWVG